MNSWDKAHWFVIYCSIFLIHFTSFWNSSSDKLGRVNEPKNGTSFSHWSHYQSHQSSSNIGNLSRWGCDKMGNAQFEKTWVCRPGSLLGRCSTQQYYINQMHCRYFPSAFTVVNKKKFKQKVTPTTIILQTWANMDWISSD